MFPVEEKLDAVKRALRANRSVVLTAPPGSGKTTCVPPALLGEPWLRSKKIVMLEPRRLAARNCAAYMARQLGEAPGGTIGYQVRLERKISSATRLEIVTEGLLTQRLLTDPELKDVGLVIFDEFHERSLACDTSFALALEVRRALRDDLRLLVMSATLDADEVAGHLGDADIVRAEGRLYPIETKYLGDMSLPGAVARALRETDGNILCFLPGEGEIRRAREALGNIAEADVLPLYGALPKEEQDRVFESNPPRRRIILATSIAETSLTIPNISVVIDSGLMRIPRFAPATGMSGLVTVPLSLDRADQRRGRAGRVRAGTCYRLWTEGSPRPKRMTPEILDADLAPLVLTSAAWGALERASLPWMTPPPASAWNQAAGLLKLLGALAPDGRLTRTGEAMAKLPMHPRLANMCLVGGRGPRVALLAAVLEEGPKTRETDIREVADEILETPKNPASRCVLELARRFQGGPAEGDFSDGALLALAFPDRIARNRGNGSFRMVSGRGAFVDQTDALARAPFVVCCRLDDRTGDAKLFLGSPIELKEIEDLFGDRIVEEPYCVWDRALDRVKSGLRRRLGEMTLGEKPVAGKAAEDFPVLDAFCEGARLKGVANWPCWTKETLQLRARIQFLHRTLGADWPEASDAEILSALPAFASGMTKGRDLERLDLARLLESILVPVGHDRRELDRLAPTRMEVPSGKHMLIHYEGAEPTVAVRLQECFGLLETPKVAGGRVPIVMTLLSPAQRPIQITKDLAGFWKDTYPLVRKDMRGRYPKHPWPEMGSDPSGGVRVVGLRKM